MFRFLRKMLIGLISLVLFVVLIAVIFINTAPQFGQAPQGERKAELENLDIHKNGKLHNEETPKAMSMAEMPPMISDWLFAGGERTPKNEIPVLEVDPNIVGKNPDSISHLTWFGHSSFLLESEGMNILIDPVLGPAASPISLITKRFNPKLPIEIEDLPRIDIVLISHDHYDHLDYYTINLIKDKVGHFLVPLGIGEHLEFWGVSPDKITELKWWENSKIGGLDFTCTPARHFSGRLLPESNLTLWSSWVIKGDHTSIFFSGDSGYTKYFKEIGEKYGPFDYSLMECGQYGEKWPDIHMFPKQTVQAHLDVKAKFLIPIHWGMFELALHKWDDSVERAEEAADKENVNLLTPPVGERMELNKTHTNNRWWKNI